MHKHRSVSVRSTFHCCVGYLSDLSSAGPDGPLKISTRRWHSKTKSALHFCSRFVLEDYRKKTYLKVRCFAVTLKTTHKNDQVEGIIDSTLFYNVSSNHNALIFQFLGQSCLSSRQMISCRRLVI